MKKRQVLFSMFYDLARTRTREMYRARDGSAAVMRAPGGPLWLWAHDDADETSLFLFFDEALAHCGITVLDTLIAEPRAAEACAGYYAAQMCCAYRTRKLIAYYLTKDIEYAKGSLRPAVQEDATCLMTWIKAFYAEALETSLTGTGMPLLPVHNTTSALHNRYGQLYVLTAGTLGIAENQEKREKSDEPVAMGMLCGKGGNTRRLNLLYTPPALRNHGYGKGITAALARQACAEGCLPVLYTAENNMAANHLYRSLGFAEAGQLLLVTFEKILTSCNHENESMNMKA